MTTAREIRAHGEASPAITVGLDSLSYECADAEARSAQDATSVPQGRRLDLRRGVLDDRVHRGQARVAAPSPAVCRRGRRVRASDTRAERGDHVLGPRHRREGAGVVREPRPERRQGAAGAIRCPGG